MRIHSWEKRYAIDKYRQNAVTENLQKNEKKKESERVTVVRKSKCCYAGSSIKRKRNCMTDIAQDMNCGHEVYLWNEVWGLKLVQHVYARYIFENHFQKKERVGDNFIFTWQMTSF